MRHTAAPQRLPALTGAPIDPVTPPDYSSFIYGVAAQFVFDAGISSSAVLASAGANGVQMARSDCNWKFVEPNAPISGVRTYNWNGEGGLTAFDTVATAYATAGLRWLPILWDSPQWAARYPVATYPQSSHSSPSDANMADWLAFVAAFVSRYGPGGTFWAAHPTLPYLPTTHYEVWNEENAGYGRWWGTALSNANWLTDTTAAAEYASLFSQTSAAIKALQSTAKVFMGGLTGGGSSQGNTTWVQRVWAAAPTLSVDAVAVHPYSGYINGTQAAQYGQFVGSTSYAYPTVKLLRQALNAIPAAASTPLYITEAGWSVYTGTDPSFTAFSDASFVPPSPQVTNWAYDLQSWAQDAPRSDCNIQMLIIHTLVSDEDSLTDRERWMGIWNKDGSMKAPATSYTAAIKRMRGQSMSADKTSGLPLTGAVIF